jgi:4-diphosphocytidyl-2-C-methyl-D-erythritol kinase
VSTAVTVAAHAKLTRTLRVIGVRHDGYHLIDAEMVTLALADSLEISPHDEDRPPRIEVTGPHAGAVGGGGDNLVARALALCGRRADVRLRKEIPAGGGLGGGSADAAAVLRWAGWRDLEGAARIGADVPFCLAGGRARVGGIGEIVRRLPHVDLVVTLVVPPFGVSTPAVYAAWDELARRAPGTPAATGPNDLEAAACVVEPRLARWREDIRRACGATPTLAGSGATWWLDGDHGDAARTLEGATVVVTRTLDARG